MRRHRVLRALPGCSRECPGECWLSKYQGGEPVLCVSLDLRLMLSLHTLSLHLPEPGGAHLTTGYVKPVTASRDTCCIS